MPDLNIFRSFLRFVFTLLVIPAFAQTNDQASCTAGTAKHVSRIRETVIHLSERIGPRAPGSKAEAAAAQYLAQVFRNMGLECKIEPFDSPSHHASAATLQLTEENGKKFTCLPVQFAVAGTGCGRLIFLGSDTAVSIPKDLSGYIGLWIPAGGHTAKIAFLRMLEKRGLKGLISISQYMDTIETKNIRYPEIEHMPMVSVSWRTGCHLRQLEGQKLTMTVSSDGVNLKTSQNVVATLPGGINWLAISAHCDTAPFAPGALDNGSGVALLMELARRFTGQKLPATVHFIVTGSEEYGALDGTGRGAQAYYKQREADLEHCLGHVEIDDVGNLLGSLGLSTGGSERFLDRVTGGDANLRRLCSRGSVGCDHGAAEQRGIPYVWFSDACGISRPCYHSPEDTIEFIDFVKIATYIPTIEGTIRRLAEAPLPYRFSRDGERLIRPARYADIPAILEITRLASTRKNDNIEDIIKKRIYESIVCEAGGRIVGYATYILDSSKSTAKIGNNTVHPDFQNRGIDKALQAEVRQRMEEEGFSK